MTPDILVVGAGIAGLAVAHALERRGRTVVVLERARGVGGRCATRRVGEVPVDFGLPFLHGRDPGFLAAVSEVNDATPIRGWPARRVGRGVPCQPEAFEGQDELWVFREGLTRFPKHLARDLHVRLNHPVVAMEAAPAGNDGLLSAVLASGERLEARAIVLTPPVPHALGLLTRLADDFEEVRALRPLLDQIRMLPCLAVIARYPAQTPRPDWDVFYPDTTTIVHSVLHDSTKRGAGIPLHLVVQARPGFSREQLETDPGEWKRDLLWEAGEFLGPWAERPETIQHHRWTHARVARPFELAQPVCIRLPNGALLGLCGDAFSPAGGAEGAWLSGHHLAAKLDAQPSPGTEAHTGPGSGRRHTPAEPQSQGDEPCP